MCHQLPKHYIEIWHERPFSLHRADQYANELVNQISDDELSVNALQNESQQDKESRRQRNRRGATRRNKANARAQHAPAPHGARNLQQDLDEAANNAFDSPLINLAEAAILMQALLDTPQIYEIQRLTRDALRQIGRQNPAPSASHNSRTPATERTSGSKPRQPPVWPTPA